MKKKNFGPYEVTQVKGNDRYGVQKIGIHEGPHQSSSCAEYMIPWTKLEDKPMVAMMRFSQVQPTIKRLILIEGNIGSGNSTLLSFLEKFNGIQTIPEPIDKWKNLNGSNLLQLMYENPQKWAFPFQSYVMLTQLENYITMSSKPTQIMERSILSTRNCFIKNLFEENKIEKVQYDIIEKWCEFAENNFKIEPHLIIYLRTTPEIAFERAVKRKRPEELQLPIRLFQRLHDYHENWLFKSINILFWFWMVIATSHQFNLNTKNVSKI